MALATILLSSPVKRIMRDHHKHYIRIVVATVVTLAFASVLLYTAEYIPMSEEVRLVLHDVRSPFMRASVAGLAIVVLGGVSIVFLDWINHKYRTYLQKKYSKSDSEPK
jgi:hypothetical protein